jgi:tRNA G10  N-methylase Trm11
MQYRFETEKRNYEDYSSGRVLHSQPGATSFPARLASEVFRRAVAAQREQGRTGPYTVFDPCCGGAYLLTVLGLMHGDLIARVIAADVDNRAVELARRNLALLTPAGINDRMAQINQLFDAYGKESHREALESAKRLKAAVEARQHSIDVNCRQADALRLDSTTVSDFDILITDVPYGDLTSWTGAEENGMEQFLGQIAGVTPPGAVLAIIADKGQKARHEALERVERFQVGKRQVEILRRRF